MRHSLLLVAAIGTAVSVLYLATVPNYSLGTMAEPGPGLYPLVVGSLMLLGFLGVGLEAAWGRSNGGVDWPGRAGRFRIAAVLAACAFYVVSLPHLGHAVAGSLVALVVLQVMGVSSWRASIALALAMGLGSHLLFTVALGVPLPAGFWLG